MDFIRKISQAVQEHNKARREANLLKKAAKYLEGDEFVFDSHTIGILDSTQAFSKDELDEFIDMGIGGKTFTIVRDKKGKGKSLIQKENEPDTIIR